ncbi:sensor histidine kinase [Stigmatella aurantiaca]|uniref:histidine kinase n=1 Tax=Stigmatella aurantiaca (strain DW4/3-1) TaxID=378806 RepID=Q09C25_STIAD|nr:ATP-binding protein [Stigmatella aurantiaca]ADO74385.1 Sensor protein [Stigmatella aurantiaca DW4/3-1]EAU69284.1 PAS/PAC sensor hybrid histidine kinase [Stigmatella aurantiaca DW4/3-1]
MSSTSSAEGPEPRLERKSLVFAVLMPLLSALDVLTLSRFIPEAFALRVGWGIELALFALSEERYSTIASGLACLVGTVWLVQSSGVPFSQGIAWVALVVLSTFFGGYGSSHFRKGIEGRNEARVERARREAAEALARTVRHQAQSEKLATVGRLAANVMHEINNPLAFVRSNLHFLQKELLALSLPSEVRMEFEEVLSETRTGLDRTQQIAADLRGFSRMDMEEPRPCLLTDVVENAVRLAQVRLKHVAQVRVDVPGELPPVFATPRRLVQVLLNLLVNAGDAIEESGRERGDIIVRAERKGPRMVLVVEDNGPGFPPEVLPHLFESFFTTKGPERGTGLGLVISRELLGQFGATLSAENRAEGGARLRIEFP